MNILKTYCPSVANVSNAGGILAKRKMELMGVLTQDDAGLYAVYIGLFESHERGISQKDKDAIYDGAAQAIALSGNKLPFRDIGMFFRGIKETEYRA